MPVIFLPIPLEVGAISICEETKVLVTVSLQDGTWQIRGNLDNRSYSTLPLLSLEFLVPDTVVIRSFKAWPNCGSVPCERLSEFLGVSSLKTTAPALTRHARLFPFHKD